MQRSPRPRVSRRSAAFLAAILLTPLGFHAERAFAADNTFFVSTSGNDSSDGSQAKPWRTIQRAVSAQTPMPSGATIVVAAGEYRETTVKIEKPGITLKGEPGATLVNVDEGEQRKWFNRGALEVKRVNNVTITGMTIDANSNIWGGIVGNDLAGLRVLDNNIKNTLASGVIVLHGGSEKGEGEVQSRDLKVLRNNLFNTGIATNDQEALSIWGVDGFEVAYNRVEQGQREGIDAKVGARNGSIHHNTVRRQALWFAPASDAGPAIYIDANRADVFNIDIYNNLIEDNLQHAIAVVSETNDEVRDIRIYNNVARRNGRPGKIGSGVSICSNASNIDIAYNTFYDLNNAVEVNSGCYFAGTPRNVTIRNNVISGMRWRLFEISAGLSVTLRNNVSTRSAVQFKGSAEQLWNAPGSNNQLVDAIGFAAAPDDLRLAAGSPAIDVGSSATPSYGNAGLIDTDFVGAARPQGNGADAGAYEFGSTVTPTTTTTTVSAQPTTTMANESSSAIVTGGSLVTGWQSYSWSGTLASSSGEYNLTGAGPWVGVAFTKPGDAPIPTDRVANVALRYRAPNGPIQVLAYNNSELVGKVLLDSAPTDALRSAVIPWASFGSPPRVTSIIVQDASGRAATISIQDLALISQQ
jgi:Protein of unknown function (DUF1565)